MPSTGERAFVQVKSKTTPALLAKYIGDFRADGSYDKMFYVYHTAVGHIESDEDEDGVFVLGPDKFAELVQDAGLSNWLIRKVS